MWIASVVITPAAYLLSYTGTPPGPVTSAASAPFLLQRVHGLPISRTVKVLPGVILLYGNLVSSC